MKKKIFAISAFVLIIITALVLNQNIYSNSSNSNPAFEVTVYKNAGTTPQGNAEVIVENSNGTTVKTGSTHPITGIVNWVWDLPNGDYTIKTWYPSRPNDQQSAQKTVTYSGSSIYTTITLGPVY